MTEKSSKIARSTQGVVSAPHHLAASAGRDVLARGGNALEAAIATGAVLTVVYPHMNSIGGDAFFLVGDAQGQASGIDGAGPAARACSIEAFRARGHAAMPKRGPWAASTVAGMVAVWGEAYRQSREEWGGKLSWDSLLEPAITLAREGFPGSASAEASLRAYQEVLSQSASFMQVFAPGGKIPAAGQRCVQTALAESLSLLARDGADSFYRGELAARIASGLAREGSPLAAEDFASFHCRRVAPISTHYRNGGEALNMPPPTVGMTALTILGILRHFNLRGMDPLSAQFIHLHVEAAKLAHALRDQTLGDPDLVEVPVGEMLSPQFLKKLAARIDPERAAPFGQGPAPGDTVWFGVMDGDKRSVSAIQSLCWEYGSGVMAGDTGIVWQNRGHGFSFDAAHPNALLPGKRPSHTLNAPLYKEDGRISVVYGTMGGEAQPQISAAVFTRMHDLGMALDDALNAPRWVIGRAWGDQSPTSLKLEQRFSPQVFEQLQAMGHDCEWFDEYSDFMGHAGLIRLSANGEIEGAADPRSDGAALGV
jgi:gamma-glutamyltranspeptidase/glutathione hydrolase